MNNGKVRIYELSRELNLDNKDVLAVCDQLNISAKSHSSTITEHEAERIRAAAQNYSASHASSGKAATKTPQSSTKSKGASKPPVRKQQILEIRRHQSATPPNPPEPPREPTTSSSPATIPSSPSRPTKPEMKLTAPNRPVRSDVEQESATDQNLTEPEETPVVSAAPVAEPEPEVETATPPDKPSPELIKPPARPVAEPVSPSSNGQSSPAAPTPPSTSSTPPPVKRARDKVILPRREAKPEGSSEPSRPQAPTGSNRVIKAGSSKSVEEKKPALQPKPTLELKRPPRPMQAATDVIQDETEKEPDIGPVEEGVVELEKPRLRRPAPPRTPKQGGKWDEEDEEELARKSGKAAPKAKRRGQPIIDDDEEFIEDLDDELDSGAGPDQAQVILSLARPPKPKQKPNQTKPAAATPAAQKNRRPTSAANRENTGARGRRDRREEAKSQKPEKLILTSSLTVHELAEEMKVPETEIIKTLFLKGIAVNVNQTLDIPTAQMVAEEFDIEVETAEAEAQARKVTEMIDAEDLEHLHRRPPVVTIMGHVDHGKTTLLDSIRKTKVAQGEAGGITQHIGAYHVDLGEGEDTQQIVFLDTPGHEAFTAMRARGARVTDIAILVVAADDGVRPQTIEAISHAKAAGVPIVVAINKIDKEEANPDRVKQELTEFGLVPEEWGGETIMVPVSAINGQNLDDLLEMILLVAEVEDLQANPNRAAKGTVVEANLDKSRGPVATLLIQNGTLRVGDCLVVGAVFGKVRAMIDDRGNRVDAAAPSFAVEVLGLNDVPAAGDEFEVFQDEKQARAIANDRADQQRQSRLQQAMASRRVTLNTLSAQAQEGELKELNLILKADVQGSVEAILGSLQQLPQNEVQVRVLLAAPGEVTETDVDLAAASSAVIVGFNTTLASGARRAADEAGVDVREYDVIYKLLDDIQGAMEGLLEPEMVEEPLGQVSVRAVFPVGRGAVAGCYVQSGKAIRNCRLRVRRGNEVVYDGSLDSLKRVKDDVKEVNAGFECGIGVDSFNAWQEGDVIETYRLVSKRRTLAMT